MFTLKIRLKVLTHKLGFVYSIFYSLIQIVLKRTISREGVHYFHRALSEIRKVLAEFTSPSVSCRGSRQELMVTRRPTTRKSTIMAPRGTEVGQEVFSYCVRLKKERNNDPINQQVFSSIPYPRGGAIGLWAKSKFSIKTWSSGSFDLKKKKIGFFFSWVGYMIFLHFVMDETKPDTF